jgi:bla regulator protein blaR1
MIDVLLASLWQGALVFAIAAGANMLVPRRHAATRYAVWFVSLLALLVLPFIAQLSFGTPSSTIFNSVTRTTSAVSKLTEQTSNAAGFWFAAIWAAGFIVCVVRITISYFRLGRILQSVSPASQIAEGVFTSPLVSVPIAAGLWRPIVIIPNDLSEALPPSDLAAIISHERAHIARHDILGNVAQRAIEALLFFNPWVYLIGRQLEKEREAACDDLAVNAGSNPNSFASCLAALALRVPHNKTTLLTPSAIWPKRILVVRIERLLNGKAIQVKINYAVVATAVTLFGLLGFALQNPKALGASTSCSSSVEIIHPVKPNISEALAKAHPNATVELQVTVTAHGNPSDIIRIKSSGNDSIDYAVLLAARNSTYRPEMQNCKAVSGGEYLFRADIGP